VPSASGLTAQSISVCSFVPPPHDTSTAQLSGYGELAQLGERLVCNQEVTGSSPVFSTLLNGGALWRSAADLRSGELWRAFPGSRAPSRKTLGAVTTGCSIISVTGLEP
jgi:hypothetical protein